MQSSTSLSFSKYHGLGNDFILIDNRRQSEPCLTPEQAVQWCDRHFGIGADGVIFALPGTEGADYTMRIFNSDGSEPEMCGNGIRCLAKFIHALEVTDGQATSHETKTYRIQTLAGPILPRMETNGQVTVNMGLPWLLAEEIPTSLAEAQQKVVNYPLMIDGKEWAVTCVSMGNPHCITFVEDTAAIPLETLGPKFEHHLAFPKRINTEFVEVVSDDYLKMRVWERGAGITLACGTGACATLVAGVLNGKSARRATVELPGGCLLIEWADDQHLYMTGPAERVFDGVWRLDG